MNPSEVSSENYSDILEAVHCWLSLNHEGQSSETYKLLCQSQFHPGLMWSESRCEEENEYLQYINKDNVKEFMDAGNYFLDIGD